MTTEDRLTESFEKYLRSEAHDGTETHTMGFDPCRRCEIGMLLRELDRVRESEREKKTAYQGLQLRLADTEKERDDLRAEKEKSFQVHSEQYDRIMALASERDAALADLKKEREWKETFMEQVEGEAKLNERWQQECLRRDKQILAVRDAALAECERLKIDYEHACETVAKIHAAAVGEITGPRRGVIEDVEDLRKDRDRWKARHGRLREALEWSAIALEAMGARNKYPREALEKDQEEK